MPNLSPTTPTTQDPLSAYTSIFSGVLDGLLASVETLGVFALVLLVGLIAGCACVFVVSVVLSSQAWRECALTCARVVSARLVDTLFGADDTTSETTSETTDTTRAVRLSAQSITRMRIDELPAEMRTYGDALVEARTRIDMCELSDWPDAHQAIGIGREEGYRITYDKPLYRVEDVLADALAELSE